jgi:hypothetical protein
MTIEFSDNTLYEIYCNKRESLPLYYCRGGIEQRYLCLFDKGMYRCEEVDKYHMKVYATHKGTIVSKFLFNLFFKKPSKIQLFIYNHLYFLWL